MLIIWIVLVTWQIKEALNGAPEMSEKRYVIYIKKGVYKENVEVKKKKWNVMLVGDGMGVTVISGDRNFIDGWTTFRSATLGECFYLSVLFYYLFSKLLSALIDRSAQYSCISC
jgi:Pectinesterase